MTEEELEPSTPTNEDGDDQPNDQEESTEEKKDPLKDYDQQRIRAEKAESETKKLKAQLAEKAETKTPKKEEDKKQLDEPDYARLAFLEGKGVKHPDDQKIVQDEAERLKLPLTDILGMEYLQAKLKKAASQREAEEGMPEGVGKSTASTKNSVEYWVNKTDKDGNFMSPTDLDLFRKVKDARVKKESKASMFSDTLYTG